MSIYDKSTKLLMRDFAAERLAKGQVFEKADAVKWFADRYPKIRPTTVQMHVEAMAVNAPSREFHPNVRAGSGHDLFYKVGPGKFRLWELGVDPAPSYRVQLIAEKSGLNARSETEEEIAEEADTEFAYERDLRNYLARNLPRLEPGLKLYKDEDDDFDGVEFPVGGRFIDILAIDAEKTYVVIELKVSRGYDRTIGQLLRYMAWVKGNLSGGKEVRGFIVASEITNDLKLAASLIPNVRLVEYEIEFRLKPLPA